MTLTKLKQNYQVYPGHHAAFVLHDVLITNEDLLTFLQKSKEV